MELVHLKTSDITFISRLGVFKCMEDRLCVSFRSVTLRNQRTQLQVYQTFPFRIADPS